MEVKNIRGLMGTVQILVTFICLYVCMHYYYGLLDSTFYKGRGVDEEIALHLMRLGMGNCACAGGCSYTHKHTNEYIHEVLTVERLHAAFWMPFNYL